MGLTFNLGRVSPSVFTDSSLNVGIGAAPSGSYKLEVTGTFGASGQSILTGNVGIGGVTPSAWNANYKAINIGNVGFIYSRTATDQTAIGTNWYRSTGGAFLYQSNGFATHYEQSDGTHAWYNAPSGTAGAAITLTERMRITSAGNVGIGTATPTSSTNYTSLAINGTTGSELYLRGGGVDYGYMYANSGLVVLATQTAIPLTFQTNATERMRITSGGQIGMNTTSFPGSETLTISSTIAGSAAYGLFIQGNAGAYTQYAVRFFNTQGGVAAVVGRIIFDTTSTSYLTGSSDLKLKKNIEDWNNNVLDVFKNASPKTFNFITEQDTNKKTKGFIAQDLFEYFPEAYPITEDDCHSFNPSGMVVYLMKGLKEAATQIQELNERLNKAGL
jgi:hypothetical protein